MLFHCCTALISLEPSFVICEKKEFTNPLQFRWSSLEKATLLIKAEVKIWHSESVTLCRPLKSVSPFTFSNPARGTQVSLGESDEGWVHSFYSRMWLTRLGLWAVYTIEPKISHYLFFLYELHTMSGAQITVLKYLLTCSFFRANLQNNDPV